MSLILSSPFVQALLGKTTYPVWRRYFCKGFKPPSRIVLFGYLKRCSFRCLLTAGLTHSHVSYAHSDGVIWWIMFFGKLLVWKEFHFSMNYLNLKAGESFIWAQLFATNHFLISNIWSFFHLVSTSTPKTILCFLFFQTKKALHLGFWTRPNSLFRRGLEVGHCHGQTGDDGCGGAHHGRHLGGGKTERPGGWVGMGGGLAGGWVCFFFFLCLFFLGGGLFWGVEVGGPSVSWALGFDKLLWRFLKSIFEEDG